MCVCVCVRVFVFGVREGPVSKHIRPNPRRPPSPTHHPLSPSYLSSSNGGGSYATGAYASSARLTASATSAPAGRRATGPGGAASDMSTSTIRERGKRRKRVCVCVLQCCPAAGKKRRAKGRGFLFALQR